VEIKICHADALSYTVLLLKMYLVSRIDKYFNWKVG